MASARCGLDSQYFTSLSIERLRRFAVLQIVRFIVTGTGVLEQKPRDSNDRSSVGPSTHWPTYQKSRSDYDILESTCNSQSKQSFLCFDRKSIVS